jgi:hypothetical protein
MHVSFQRFGSIYDCLLSDGFLWMSATPLNEKQVANKSQAFLSAIETRRSYYGLEPTLPEGLTEQKVTE